MLSHCTRRQNVKDHQQSFLFLVLCTHLISLQLQPECLISSAFPPCIGCAHTKTRTNTCTTRTRLQTFPSTCSIAKAARPEPTATAAAVMAPLLIPSCGSTLPPTCVSGAFNPDVCLSVRESEWRERGKERERERERARARVRARARAREKERERERERVHEGGGFEEEQAHLLVDMRSSVNRFGRNKVLMRIVIGALCFFLR